MLSETARIGGGVEGGFTQATAHTQSNAPRPFEPAGGTSASERSDPALRLGPNPAITYDLETRTVLFQVLDRETGEVMRQFPAEYQIEAYRRQIRETPPEIPSGSPKSSTPAADPPPASTEPAGGTEPLVV